LASTLATATTSNRQRKVVRDDIGHFHLVYESGGDIWYTKSSDQGATWSSEKLVSDGLGGNSKPAVDVVMKDVNEMHVYFAWVKNGSSRLRETWGANNWGAIVSGGTVYFDPVVCAALSYPIQEQEPYAIPISSVNILGTTLPEAEEVSAVSAEYKYTKLTLSWLESGNIYFNQLYASQNPQTWRYESYSPQVSENDGLSSRGKPSVSFETQNSGVIWVAYDAIDPSFS